MHGSRRSPELIHRRRTLERWIWGVGWVALATMVLLVRQRGVPPWNSMWAEDGAVVLEDALLHGPLASLALPEPGFMLLAPRLLGELATQLPLRAAPVALSVGAALLASSLSLYVYWASGAVLRTRWGRATLAGVMIVAPWAAHEVVNIAANLIWYLLFAAFWSLLDRPSSRPAAVASATVATVAALSTPLVVFFAPLAIWRLRRSTDHLALIPASLFLLGLIAQLLFVVLADEELPGTRHLEALPGAYALRVAGLFLVGNHGVDEAWRWLGWAYPIAAVVLLAFVAGAGIRAGDRRSRIAILGMMGFSVLFFVVPFVTRGLAEALDPPDGVLTVEGARYAFVPLLFLAATVIVATENLANRRFAGRRTVGTVGAMCVVVLVTWNLGFVRGGPQWGTELRGARARCVRPIDTVDIPIAPVGWSVTIACSRVDPGLIDDDIPAVTASGSLPGASADRRTARGRGGGGTVGAAPSSSAPRTA